MEGPRVELSPNAAISLAMALHELGTNALKYGALASPDGIIDVTWRVSPATDAQDGAKLLFHWRERDGPAVAPPAREGFGSRMLERGVARELNGRVTLDYRPDGLVCDMEFPIDGKIRL